MRKLKFIMGIITVLFTFVLMTANADDGMQVPKPIDNKVYDAMVGTWVGESDMMRGKMHDVLKIRWDVNHQFLVMDLKAEDIKQPNKKYEGMGVFGIDATGNAKTWWFDSWGADAVATGTGTFENNNKLTLTDSKPTFSETRIFEVNGNTMIMTATGNMVMDGKTVPFQQKVIYKKK